MYYMNADGYLVTRRGGIDKEVAGKLLGRAAGGVGMTFTRWVDNKVLQIGRKKR